MDFLYSGARGDETKPPSWFTRVALLRDIAEALAYLHLVHGYDRVSHASRVAPMPRVHPAQKGARETDARIWVPVCFSVTGGIASSFRRGRVRGVGRPE